MIAIYARVSTEEQARYGYSIPAQIRECQNLIGSEPAQIYADEGVTGEILERPALGRLRARIEQGQIRRVVFLDPDRLSRKLLNQLLLTEEWQMLGVELNFVNGEYSRSPEGTLFYALRGAISEFEKAKITERMCRGRREKARQGRVLRDFKIYGYDFDPQAEQLIANEKEAIIVRQIFSWFTAPPRGMRGIAGIARALSSAQVPTKRGAVCWHRQVIRQILSNTTYIGEFYQNKWDTTGRTVQLRPRDEWILIPCPALVDLRIFTKCQALLNQARRRYSGPESDFLLSGLVRCHRCQQPLRGKTLPKRSLYLEGNRGGCGLVVEKELLEARIWKWFWDLLQKSAHNNLCPEPDFLIRRELLRILIKEIRINQGEVIVVTF